MEPVMDPTTQHILERTRQRRLQLDLEFRTSVSETDHLSTPSSISAPATDSSSPSANGLGFDGGFKMKKRKSTQDENICANTTMPSKKSSFDEFEDDCGKNMTPSNTRNSYYPVHELETLAKQIDFDTPVYSSTKSVSPSIISKSDDSCKNRFAELAAKLDNFEVEPTRLTKRNVQVRCRGESPGRWGSFIPSANGQKHVNLLNNVSPPSDTAVENCETMDSGIETFYRPMSVENDYNGLNTDNTDNDSSKKDVLSEAVAEPDSVATQASNAAQSTALNFGIQDHKNIAKDHRQGGLGQFIVANATVQKGTVASLAGRLETEMKSIIPSDSAKQSSAAAFKKPGKLVSTTVNQGRERVITAPVVRQVAKKPDSSSKKAQIVSGIDSRPRPAVSKLRKRWEKATQSGVPLNPDESILSQDSFISTATKMALPPNYRLKNVTNIDQPPQPAFNGECSKDLQNVAEPLTPSEEDSPITTSTPTSLTPPALLVQEVTSPNIHEVPTFAVGFHEASADGNSMDSSALSDYLNEAISCAQAAAKTPPKEPAKHHVSNWKSVEIKPSPQPVPLVHTVSMYRKKEQLNRAVNRPESVVVKPPQSLAKGHEHDSGQRQTVNYDQQVRNLEKLLIIEQEHISQASRALNLCRSTGKFRGSTEEIAAEKALLLATQARRCLLDERSRLDQCYRNRIPITPSSPLGTLTVNSIRIPLRREFFSGFSNDQPGEMAYFIGLLKYHDTMHVTQMVDSKEIIRNGCLTFSNYIQFTNLPPDFEIKLEIYGLLVHQEPLSPSSKSRTLSSRLLTLGRQGTKTGLLTSLPTTSLGGPNSVMETSFKLAGCLPITLSSVGNRKFTLEGLNYSLPLEGGIYLELRCVCDEVCTDTERGFLHQHTQIGGTAAWERFWVVLGDGHLHFYKYPEEEIDDKSPLDTFHLKDCISSAVGPASRRITTRPNTFAFESKNNAWYIFAADSAEDTTRWTIKLNQTLKNIRMWSVPGSNQ